VAAEPHAAGFDAIGTTHRILATDPAALEPAVAAARAYLNDLDRAASRFRDDSEVSRLAHLAETGDTWGFASPMLLDHLDAAWHAARISDGLVDVTVGSAVIASGYDADLDVVRVRHGHEVPATPPRVPGWRRVVRSGNRVSIPQGTVLDFGATAKAHAADALAADLAARLPGGFLVNLGGDIATSGRAPERGWRVGVEAADGSVRQVVAITDQGIATSSTQLRRWVTDAGTAHHIVDPRTGRTAPAVWAQVTCIAANALEANTASTASVVLGEVAPAWLADKGVAARLDRIDGSVEFTPGWPVPGRRTERHER
jgi:thiamine biosynthesis lipoprotein